MRLRIALALCLLAAVLAGCAATPTHATATITFSTGVVLHVELYDEAAPNTVANFISLAESGFYNQTHLFSKRQGDYVLMGSKNADGTGTVDYTIAGEFEKNGYKSDFKFTAGSLFMHRPAGYDTASCLFGILRTDRTDFNTNYAPLGRVVEQDLPLLEELFDFDIDTQGQPLQPITITAITIDRAGRQFATPQVVSNRN